MTILIDSPAWPAHGRLWGHLVSDVSLAELHAFASLHSLPRRGFERDHYDVPAELYDSLVAAGAVPVSSRDIVTALTRAGLRRRKAVSMARRAPGRALLRPPRLRPGDLVAVPALAGLVPADRLAAGVARLESWGLRVRVGAHALDRHPTLGHLAGTDTNRAADFANAWADPEVRGVVVARGGFGTQRLLDRLDWRRLAEAEPKVLVGFSDVTALHQAVASRLGLVTVHGHVVTSLGGASQTSADLLRRLLMEPDAVTDLIAGQTPRTLSPGVATGVLVGGNVALLASELGTTFARPANGAIVLLEDIDEPAFRLDRQLTQLHRSGWFEGVRGVVCGAFTDCGEQSHVDAVLADRLLPLGVPVLSGIDIGHTTTSLSIPLGVTATLDADGGSLRLNAPALT